MIERLSTVDVSIRGDRGIITDRHGKIIAKNIQKLTFYANTRKWLCYYDDNKFKYNDLDKEGLGQYKKLFDKKEAR